MYTPAREASRATDGRILYGRDLETRVVTISFFEHAFAARASAEPAATWTCQSVRIQFQTRTSLFKFCDFHFGGQHGIVGQARGRGGGDAQVVVAQDGAQRELQVVQEGPARQRERRRLVEDAE